METLELLNVLKNDRGNLVELLKTNYNYNYLQTKLLEIEKSTDVIGIIKDLFVGKVGNESNKQLAIYELPTYELLTIIKFICDFIKINHVEEIASGTGLLSAMLKLHLDNNNNNTISINATDGNRWIETAGQKKYFNVQSKLFLDYCLNLDQSIFNNKLLIISWIPKNDMADFIALIKNKKPKYLIIIGDMLDNIYYDKIFQTLRQNEYKFYGLPIKQICYKDHYLHNKYRSIKSSTVFATNDNNINVSNLLINIKTKYNSCLTDKTTQITDMEIIQDLIVKQYRHKFLLDNLTETTTKKLCKELNFLSNKKITIPKYITTFNEYNFWFNKIRSGKYPLAISDRNKFDEYLEYMMQLGQQNGIEILKNKGVLAAWVTTIDVAEKFIWLDFSTTNKKWKFSYDEFLIEFGEIRNSNLSNITFRSIR